MTDFQYTIVVSPDEGDEGFFAMIPDLQGCIGDGDTPQEAVVDVLNAYNEWRSAQLDRGAEIPEPGADQAEFDAFMEVQTERIETLEKDLETAKLRIKELEARLVLYGPGRTFRGARNGNFKVA